MGIFDLLSKEGRQKSALERNLKKVVDKHAQGQDAAGRYGPRVDAMNQLAQNGSPEALYGIARRFSFSYDKTIDDEQEKQHAADLLTEAGAPAVEPLKKFLLDAGSVSWGLKVLGRIAAPDEVWPIIDELLAKEPPGYTRDPDKKIEIVSWLDEWQAGKPAEVARRVTPYLADFDEGVRFAAIETIAHKKDESAVAPLVDLLTRPEEESRRIKVRVADLLVDAGWVIPGDKKEAVAKLLAGELAEYGMHHDKLIKKGR